MKDEAVNIRIAVQPKIYFYADIKVLYNDRPSTSKINTIMFIYLVKLRDVIKYHQ